ncbi:MAG: sortase [Anaerolineae bacterium]|nr:sortase [Anaerolineae bacterium]MDW8300501.1 sortase [Anaerolineae bacterium]
MYRYRRHRRNSFSFIAALLIVIGAVAVYLAFERLGRLTPTLTAPTHTPVPPTQIAVNATAQPTAPPTPSRKLPFRVAAARINLLADIVPLYFDMSLDTWNLSYLYDQAGHLEGTANMDEGGNFVLAGHVELGDGKPGPFARLSELQQGDLISIFRERSATTEVVQYVVTEVLTVAPNDFSVIRNRGYEELTLITCKDWDAQMRDYLKRVVVRARRL